MSQLEASLIMRATSTPAPGHLSEYVHNSALNVKGFERWKKIPSGDVLVIACCISCSFPIGPGYGSRQGKGIIVFSSRRC